MGLVAWSGTVDIRTTLIHGIPTAMAIGNASGAVSDTTASKSDIAFRWIGESRLVASTGDGRRPLPGEILGRNNVIVETRAAESDEPLPLGDCRCEKKK